MLTVLWHSLVGLVLLVGVTGAAVMLIAKAIASSNAHDQARCECVACGKRRIAASNKRYKKRAWPLVDKEERQGPDLGYISTIELQEGMNVIARGKEVFYTIVQKNYIEGGYIVYLKNHMTGRQSNLFIPDNRAASKLWKPMKGMGGNPRTYRGRP